MAILKMRLFFTEFRSPNLTHLKNQIRLADMINLTNIRINLISMRPKVNCIFNKTFDTNISVN